MKEKKITVSSVGNIVEVTIDNEENIIDVTIKDDMFTQEQKPLLEELIVSTINSAKEKIREMNLDNIEKNDPPEQTANNYTNMQMPNNEQMKKIMDDMKSKVSVDYKDGKPVVSVAIDSIDPSMISSLLDMLNNKK